MQQKVRALLLGAVIVASVGLTTLLTVKASDHDDGEMDLKGRSLNLTDLYVFREDWQASSGSSNNLVLVMNTNPRSMARQQYAFSTQARYEFHLSRVAASQKTSAPNGNEDVVLRFEFGAQDSNKRQPITMTIIKDGSSQSIAMGTTSALGDMDNGSVLVNNASVSGETVSVFAGLREDPFYFDVERYFRIRAYLATGVDTLGSGPTQGNGNPFRSDATAVDFTAGYNVNSIAVKIPIALLQSSAAEPIFDVWETISVPQ